MCEELAKLGLRTAAGPRWKPAFYASYTILFALFGRCLRFESLDLSRFGGQLYETSVKSHLMVKYSQHPPGVIVTSEQTVGRLNSWP